MSENKIRLAHVYLEQADVARQQGDLNGSIASFTKAIEVYKGLELWSLVADTIERAAATYKAAGKLEEAASAFQEAAQLREQLAKKEAAEEEEE